ncbi:response regulator transcription factor [Virgibacillus sediminis]|uniref:Response regulator transcription factor n=1 Tax=Virgibacillus sediminis TaxID=202260 RepID=A0ABV7A1F8_9BACI
MGNRILIIEESPHLINLLREALGETIYDYVWFENKDLFLHEMTAANFRLIVIRSDSRDSEEIMDLFNIVRKQDVQVPIMAIQPGAEDFTVALALELGIDDFVVDINRHKEIIVRVRKLLRRYNVSTSALRNYNGEVVDAGRLKILPNNYKIIIDNEARELSPQEMKLLCHLYNYKGKVFRRKELVSFLGNDLSTRAIDAYISVLRRKIEPDRNNPMFIRTKSRAGYVFDIPPED